MNPLDLTTQRVLSMHINNLEAALEQAKAAIAERDAKFEAETKRLRALCAEHYHAAHLEDWVDEGAPK